MKTRNNKYLKIFLLLIMISLPLIILARPGGGHSYSGGSSYGSGSGGGDLLSLIIWILIDVLPPEISIPLIIGLFIAYHFYNKKQQREEQGHVLSNPTYSTTFANQHQKAAAIENLTQLDPNFSRVVFLDFASLIYTKYYQFLGNKKQLATISPFFLNKDLIKQAENQNVKTTEITIGALGIVSIMQDNENTRIFVDVNANYTLENQGSAIRYIVQERWEFRRKNGVLSPEPEKMQTLSCPYCGAPADFNDAGYCNHCGNLIVPAEKQWAVANKSILRIETLKTSALLTYAYEQGTDLPTIFDPKLQEKAREFEALHNKPFDAYFQDFVEKVVKPYFFEIYKHWANLSWNKVRHLLSDRLWEAYNFWIEAYRAAGLQNKLDDPKITNVLLAKIEIDKFYEAFTVRIFASVKDYVVNKQGKVLAGYAKHPRYFTEYWTFIRRKGVEKDDYDLRTCPNCGAPADKIGQSGICEYCGAKITTGNFSWILALITQDEEYKG